MRFFTLLKAVILSFIVILPACFNVTYGQKVKINVLTYNIRFANPDDKPNTWEARKENVFNQIRKANPDVFGLQEVLNEQVKDVEIAFPGFKRVGVGRDDGKEAGEYSPLFYKADQFSLKGSGTFWLSQTPEVEGSRGWDAACNRVVTWVKLKHTESGKEFFVFCTHFDHMGVVARRKSAELLLRAVDSLSFQNQAVIVGDFNATPDSEPYILLTQKTNPHHFVDSQSICNSVVGPSYTYTGFKVGGIPGERIDYIFLKGNAKVISMQVNNFNNGEYYPSDHLPVSATIELD